MLLDDQDYSLLDAYFKSVSPHTYLDICIWGIRENDTDFELALRVKKERHRLEVIFEPLLAVKFTHWLVRRYKEEGKKKERIFSIPLVDFIITGRLKNRIKHLFIDIHEREYKILNFSYPSSDVLVYAGEILGEKEVAKGKRELLRLQEDFENRCPLKFQIIMPNIACAIDQIFR